MIIYDTSENAIKAVKHLDHFLNWADQVHHYIPSHVRNFLKSHRNVIIEKYAPEQLSLLRTPQDTPAPTEPAAAAAPEK
jgi:hypothetical protein